MAWWQPGIRTTRTEDYEDLVRTLCDPAGEENRNGRTYLLFVCPHPYCNHESGSNIIDKGKEQTYSIPAFHLKKCIGRDSIKDLDQLFLKIKARPDEREQILTEFRASEAAQDQISCAPEITTTRDEDNEDLVRTLCDPAGEEERNWKTFLLFVCPHPYCNHESGSNIIGKGKEFGWSRPSGHLRTCIGRDNIEDLNQLFLKIKARPDEREQILTEFRASEAAQNQKPKYPKITKEITNEDLVRTLCNPAGEQKRSNGRRYLLFVCPHPHCIKKNGFNIISKGKSQGWSQPSSHLRKCIGRDNIEDLNQLLSKIKAMPDEREQILTEFRAGAAQNQKPKYIGEEDLARTLCDPAGEKTIPYGKTYLLFVCPHPYCNQRSGSNIIRQEKNKGYSNIVGHLKHCIGRDSIQDLNQLYLKIKEWPDEREQILSEFREEAAENQKPKPPKPKKLKTTKTTSSRKPATASSRKRRERPYDLLSEHETKDTRNSVEHVLMIGSKNRHDMKRRQHFHANHQVLLDKEHEEPLDAPPVNPFGPTEHPDNNVFAEDVRIYGGKAWSVNDHLSPMLAWPSKTTKVGCKTLNIGNPYRHRGADKEWDMEHGDTINPLAFSMARLSQVMPKEEDGKFVDGRNRLINTKDIDLSDDQIPRALLLRCWERAVHAASCVTHAPKVLSEDPSFEKKPSATKGATTGNATTAPPNARSIYEAEQEKISCSSKETIDKCKSLNLTLRLLRYVNLTCPHCSATFDEKTQLEKHFFGFLNRRGKEDTGKSKSACCWALIKEKHLSLIDTALQRHIQTQTESLLGAVMTNAKEKVPDNRGTKKLRLMNWHDILKSMESTLESSRCLTDGNGKTEGSNPVLESLETKSKASPIVLNSAILEAVRRRLIDRYADVAR
jgi:hypothetical protein